MSWPRARGGFRFVWRRSGVGRSDRREVDDGGAFDGGAHHRCARSSSHRGVRAGYQKFFGVEAELDQPCPIDVPVLMDARVAQTDGFRFMYVLPLSPTRVLIEDTYFSDEAELNAGAIEGEIGLYAAANGYSISGIVRREAGVLPMPWGGEPLTESDGVVLAGFGGGWFHPATGYSFPAAAQLAEFMGGGGLESAPGWRAFRAAHRSRRS